MPVQIPELPKDDNPSLNDDYVAVQALVSQATRKVSLATLKSIIGIDTPVSINETPFTIADSPKALTIDDSNSMLVFDTSSGDITVNLPPLASVPASTFALTNLSGSSKRIIVNANGSEKIGGSTVDSISSNNTITYTSHPVEWIRK